MTKRISRGAWNLDWSNQDFLLAVQITVRHLKPIFVDVVTACTAKKTVQMKQKLSVFGCLCSFWYLHLKVCSACACACGCISSQFCQCNSPELKFLCENNESSRRVHRRRSKVHRRSKDDSALQKKVCCSLNLVALFKSSQLQAIHCNV